jgi:hypothetical protein
VRAEFALLADYANVTEEGKLNLMGVFNSVRAVSVPATVPQMLLVIRFQTDPPDRGQTKNIDVTLLDADGVELMRLSNTVQIDPSAPLVANVNQFLRFTPLRLPRFGDYSFYITVNGEQKASAPFSVDKVPSTAGTEESAGK